MRHHLEWCFLFVLSESTSLICKKAKGTNNKNDVEFEIYLHIHLPNAAFIM